MIDGFPRRYFETCRLIGFSVSMFTQMHVVNGAAEFAVAKIKNSAMKTPWHGNDTCQSFCAKTSEKHCSRHYSMERSHHLVLIFTLNSLCLYFHTCPDLNVNGNNRVGSGSNVKQRLPIRSTQVGLHVPISFRYMAQQYIDQQIRIHRESLKVGWW